MTTLQEIIDQIPGFRFKFEDTLDILEARNRTNRKKWFKKFHDLKKKHDICCYHHFYRPGGCMKGDVCDFLHTYIPEKMPLCIHFEKGNCRKGDDCIFRHIKQEDRQPCHAYERGFCPRGPKCTRKHVHHECMCDIVEHYTHPYTARCCPEPHARQDKTFWKQTEDFIRTSKSTSTNKSNQRVGSNISSKRRKVYHRY